MVYIYVRIKAMRHVCILKCMLACMYMYVSIVCVYMCSCMLEHMYACLQCNVSDIGLSTKSAVNARFSSMFHSFIHSY